MWHRSHLTQYREFQFGRYRQPTKNGRYHDRIELELGEGLCLLAVRLAMGPAALAGLVAQAGLLAVLLAVLLA
jgi:hypothetical protein